MIEIGAKGGRLHRSIQVGIVEHQQRCLAAQFQQGRFEVARAEFADNASNMRGAREIDPSHRRVGDQPLDNRRGIRWRVADDIDHAITQASVLQYLTDQAMHRRA
ncbi:hypothetical protein D3C76_1234040 [compost metagenome]